MDPVNNYIATNEISDAFKDKYGLTEQYLKDYPESFSIALSTARCAEEDLQKGKELRQNLEEHSNGMTRLIEKSEILDLKLDGLIESGEKNTQALQNLVNSSSEMKEMTSNIANMVSICANRIFNPVRNRVKNGFHLLTGREPAAVLPRENQLAIEDNPENTIPITDTTNQTSDDEKKNVQNCSIFL